MSDLATLSAKGFHVTDHGDGTASIRWPDADPKTTFKVSVSGGTLELVPQRSATHRMLAQELGR